MFDYLHQPGFLGTNANLFSDLSLTIMVLAAVLFSIGFVMARKKRFTAHRILQTVAVVLNALVVLWAMILPFFQEVLADFMGERASYFYTATTLHALFGLAALIFGVFVMLRGNGLVPNALKFSNYKGFMRVSYALYIAATLGGVLVYLIWYVIIPNPPVYGG